MTDDRETHLDPLRIQKFASMRRSLYRGRSYALMAAIACTAAAAQCAFLAARHVAAVGWQMRPVVFLLLMVFAAAGATWFARRAMSLHHEAQQATLPEPAVPPDFSMLSDGSQRARDLEDLR
jgi:hypothetical protein